MPGEAAHASQTGGPTVDAGEVEKFARLAAEWWNPHGKLRPLHELNPARLAFIRAEAEKAFGRTQREGSASSLDPRRPLQGLTLLDIGCGGGLVAEPLTRLGARVTGIDAAEEGVGAARAHAAQSGLSIDYRVAAAEALLASGEGPFDIVIALEIVEHTADPALFLTTCARLVAPGGLLVVSTLNRTPKAFALAIVGAEYLLRWLPRGSHDWAKFLKPEEVAAPLLAEGLDVQEPVGLVWSPLDGAWRTSRDASVNYMMAARRKA